MKHAICLPVVSAACAVFLTCSAGCVVPVPLAAFSARCVGSGDELKFRDQENRLIRAGGFMLVNRSQRATPRSESTSSTSVALIMNGRSRIPTEFTCATVWLWPNEFVWAYYVAGMLHNPLMTMWYTPVICVPIPFVAPEDRVSVFPLISGHYPRNWGGLEQTYCHWGYCESVPEKRNPVIILSKDNPQKALEYWRFIYRRLQESPPPKTGSSEAAAFENQIFLHIDDWQASDVEKFVRLEIARLTSRCQNLPPQ